VASITTGSDSGPRFEVRQQVAVTRDVSTVAADTGAPISCSTPIIRSLDLAHDGESDEMVEQCARVGSPTIREQCWGRGTSIHYVMSDDASAATSASLGDVLGRVSVAVGERLPDREAAVRRAGALLLASGRVDDAYSDEMVAVLQEYGPYFVIAPGIALAHSRPSPAVRGVAFSVLTCDPPVPFGHPDNDPVSLVIGIAAPDDASHVEALRQLAELLGEDRRRERLLAARSVDEVLDALRLAGAD
jgi:PTS system ascorbate-specific IIA component